MNYLKLALAALLSLALAACFDRPTPECSFRCGTGAEPCPEGYVCASDGVCKRDDVPEDFSCPGIRVVDAAAPDGQAADAAPVDAAAADASPADASPADAMPADATPADASPADAMPDAA